MRQLRKAIHPMWLAGAVALLAVFVQPVLAETEEDAADSVVLAVTINLEIESALLEDDLQRYDALALERNRTISRLAELYRMLDEAVRSENPAVPDRVELLMQQIVRVEGERAGLLVAERVLVDKLTERRMTITMFQGQIEALSDRTETVVGRLTGLWDVTLLPLNQRGVFRLKQSGTLVSGTYRLEGGWNGSLEGTLIRQKIRLERIDSQLGRMMEFEGRLDEDGDMLRGSWLNHELAGGEGASGDWSARKRLSGS